MTVMAGHDPKDATSLADYRPDFMGALKGGELHGLSVGVVRELSGEGNSEGVRAALARTASRLEALGATVGEATLPHARYGVASYYLVAPAEASSNLARYDGSLYGSREGEAALGQVASAMRTRAHTFGPEVRRRVLMGSYALSAGYYQAYYGKALKVRRLIAGDFERAFERFDLLLTPTAPTPAYPLGERVADPLAMYLGDVNTVLANLAGLPAVSLPAGAAEDGLPCGVHFMAPALEDARLLRLSAALERAAAGAFAPLAPLWARLEHVQQTEISKVAEV
jgi:aspartyl-tRNA(Asn)/glutamyl-tRNA(Gln) amidotransferase subunit A